MICRAFAYNVNKSLYFLTVNPSILQCVEFAVVLNWYENFSADRKSTFLSFNKQLRKTPISYKIVRRKSIVQNINVKKLGPSLNVLLTQPRQYLISKCSKTNIFDRKMELTILYWWRPVRINDVLTQIIHSTILFDLKIFFLYSTVESLSQYCAI